MIRKPTNLTRRRLLASAAAGLALPATAVLSMRARATAPCPSLTAHHRFSLGAFEVVTLRDADAMLDGPWPVVGEDRPESEVQALMHEHLLPRDRFQPGFTPTLVDTGTQRILFDTGNGDKGFVPPPRGGRLAPSLQQAGYVPEQIDLVVLTHGHPDHIGGLMHQGKPAFPRAAYIMGGREFDFWAATDDRLRAPEESIEHQSARLFSSHLAPLADDMTRIGPGDEVAPGIHAVAAHGHTPGHLAFHVESRGQRLLLWGDCAHHEVASLAHPEWHALFDQDKDQGAATRKRIYDMAATERLAVVGYHTSFPSIGFVQRRGPHGYRWIPLTCQFQTS